MASSADDELIPEQTEGYKPGEKKTLDEYQKLGKCSVHTGVAREHLPPWDLENEEATWLLRNSAVRRSSTY